MTLFSLFEVALQAVMRDFPHHEPELKYLPSNVKTRIARIMAKRGLLNDSNMRLILHDGITDLDLSECDISTFSLSLISSLCPRLRRLDLGAPQLGCRYDISSKAFSHLFSHVTRLQVLSLRRCTLVDNSTVTTLVRCCPMIVSLSLSGCHMISDQSLIVIGQRCKYLQVLDLCKTKTSSEGLMALASGVCAKVIKELNISHCLNVTDEGIQSLVSNCPRLSILVFHGCPLLTSSSRDAISNTSLKQLTWTVY